jgi:hypothetical protein
MYTPFIERPQVIDNDYYIPLPTVTRKYIDRPSDSILDAIESMHSVRHEKRQEDKISHTVPNNKKIHQLKIDTNCQRLAVTYGYNTERDYLMPKINSWLSKHDNETTTTAGSDMMTHKSNHNNKTLNI